MKVSFVLIILILMTITTKGDSSGSHDDEIDQFLKKINKPALKSIKSPDGDIIDCVHMKNHPIYDHPLFKNHTIQMRPSSYLEKSNHESSNKEKQDMVTQLWTINGKCPKNSIPIRRTKKEDILRVGSIKQYMKKYPKRNSLIKPQHEYVQLKVDGKFHGTQAVINVWKPYVQTPKEFSLAQTWLVAGPYAELNTIEYGWQVYEAHYGDDKPRHFIYWTADGYQNSGCYNVECPGFVPVNEKFALGAAVSNVSAMDGRQFHIAATIWKDPHSGNWWLKLNYHLFVGYWPATLFNHLQNGATGIEWGGEIINYKDDSQHTTTHMGSGRFAWEGYQRASYFRNLEIFDENGIRKPIQGAYSYITNENCYSLRTGYEINWGNYIYYGGQGRNQYCK